MLAASLEVNRAEMTIGILYCVIRSLFFFFQAEDGIRDVAVTGVQTCALPIFDPFSKTFWIFLSNRVHPDRRGNVLPLEGRLANLAAEAVIGFNFSYVPGSLAPHTGEESASPSVKTPAVLKSVEVLDGIDVLEKQHFALLKGLRVGLITNHTGQDRGRNPTIDLLKNAPD